MAKAFALFTEDSDRPALEVGQEQISFGELADRVTDLAAATPDHGLPVLLPARQSIGFVISFLSLLRAGRPVAVISQSLTEAEARQRLDLLGSHVRLDESGQPVKTVDCGDSLCHPETAAILFTSGSTGKPKGVQLSAGNIRANTEAVLAAIGFAEAPRQSLFLALSYSFGLLGQLMPALQIGLPTRIVPRFVDTRALFVPGSAAGMWSGVPSQWKAILGFLGDRPLDEVSHVVSAGARLPLALRRQLRTAFPKAVIYSNYGLTEAAPRVLCVSSRHERFYSSCTGFAVGELEPKLLDSGELCVRGPQVMLGYLGDPAGTGEKIVDGWLRTGDHAEIADDGMVTIHGREDGLVNLAGERTSLQEIETALADLSMVSEATVLVEEDQLYDVRLVAFLVARDLSSTLSRAAIYRELAGSLSPTKIPKELYQLPSIPLTANFKTDRGRLRELRTELTPLR